MSAPDARLLLAQTSALGEGPVWDPAAEELLWVDVLDGRLHRGRLVGEDELVVLSTHEVDDALGAAVPLADGSGWVLAAGHGVHVLGRDGGEPELVVTVPEPPGPVRCNDAACDPAGRFVFGTMAYDERSPHGALHRLGLDGRLEQLRADLVISNGLGWSPDGTWMYAVDSGTRSLDRAPYDADTGEVGEFIRLRTWEDGVPDGLAVDADGALWVAIYDGGRVDVVAPDGSRRDVVRVPVPYTTSCAFVGEALDRLVVTSARQSMDEAQLAATPLGGSVFVVDGVGPGLPTTPYAGPSSSAA